MQNVLGSDHRPVKLDLSFKDLVRDEDKPLDQILYTDLENTNKMGVISFAFLLIHGLNA